MVLRYRQLLTWIVLLVCSILYNFYLLKIPVNIYDEGIILVGADRILRGQVPYADFWSMYPPGQYYVLALLFKFCSASILTERIYDIIIRSLLSISIYMIIKKLGVPSAIALIGWVIALAFLGSFPFPAYPIFPAILLINIGVYFFIYHIKTNQPHHIIYSGLFMAVSSLFRHDLAGMAAMSILLILVIRKIIDKETGFRSSYAFIIGMSLVGLPISIYLIATSGVHSLVNQLLLTPSEIMSKYRGLPYPAPFSVSVIQFYVYPFVLFAGLFAGWYLIVRLKNRSSLSYGILLSSFIGILFINQARVRSDAIHLLPTILLSAIIGPSLFFIIFQSALKALKPQNIRSGAYLFLTIVIAPVVEPIFDKIGSLNLNYFTLSKHFYKSGYARVSNDLQKLILYIRKNTYDTDAIYVGVGNHDQFTISDVIVYFLAGRAYATKYHELHPGVINTPNIQKEIIQEIKDASVKLIVLAPRYRKEPNETSVNAKIDILDDYIHRNYKKTERIGIYEVWTPNPSSPEKFLSD